MSGREAGVGAWIAGRTPPTVMSLDPWLSPEGPAAGATEAGGGRPIRAPGTTAAQGHDGAAERPPSAPVEALVQAAEGALTRALARPGRVRDSAFHLLAADALVTYACEAALESEEPEERISWILETILAR